MPTSSDPTVNTRHRNPEYDADLAVITHYLHSLPAKVESYYSDLVPDAVEHLQPALPLVPPMTNLNTRILKRLVMQFNLVKQPPYVPRQRRPKFTFIDLFSGIGGFRIPFQRLGGRCVFSSDIDAHARAVYFANFGVMPFGDIRAFTEPALPDPQAETFIRNHIPPHDILLAGFPCQPFSMMGKREGMLNKTRGTLFYDIARILNLVKPKAFLLENVEGLMTMKDQDGGRTIETILQVLRENYFVPDPKILNANEFGLAQHRRRVYIIGFRKDLGICSFEYPKGRLSELRIKHIREPHGAVDQNYYIPRGYLHTLEKHAAREKKKGNGFGYAILDDDDFSNALLVGGSGRERNLIWDEPMPEGTRVPGKHTPLNTRGVRFMTPREWARLQGFHDDFIRTDVDTQAYKQFGNTVPTLVVRAVGKNIIKLLELNRRQRE